LTPRRIAGLLLALWWIVYPLVLRLPIPLRVVHGGLVVALTLCAAVTAWRRRELALGLPVWAALVATASLLVATFHSPDVYPISERIDGAVTGLTHVLFFLTMLVLVPQRAEVDGPRAGLPDPTADRTRRALAVMLGLAALAQALVVFLNGDGLARVQGTLGNPNLFGAFVAAVGLAVGAFARWRPMSMALLALFSVMLLQTGSRGAFVAGASVLLAFAARRGVRVGLTVALIIAVFLWIVPNPLTERVSALDEHLAYSRPFLWGVGLENVAAHPLGLGAGMNKYVFPARAYDPAHPWLVAQRHEVGLTHNLFLTLALEWGWLACAAGLGLLVWTAVRALRPGPGKLGGDRLGQGAGLGAAVLLVESQVDGLEQNPLLFSLFLLLAAVVLRRIGHPTLRARVSGRVVGATLGAAALLLALAVGKIHAERLDASRATASVRAWHERTLDTDAARQRIAELTARHPDSAQITRARLDLEVAVLRRELRVGASPAQGAELAARTWQAFDAAVAANGVDPRVRRRGAEAALALYRRTGRGDAAFERYAELAGELLRLDPYDFDARRELALEAHGADRPELVQEQLGVLLEQAPYDAFGWWIRGLSASAEGRTSDAYAAFVRTRELIWEARVPSGARNPGARDAVEQLLARVDLTQLDAQRRELGRRLKAEQTTDASSGTQG